MVKKDKPSWSDKLKVNLSRIPEEGLRIHEDFPPDWLVNIPEFASGEGPHIKGEIHVEGLLLMEGENLLLDGRVNADLATICTRCGEAINYPLYGDFQRVLVKGAPPDLGGETVEEAGKDYYEGMEVDLAPVFREELALLVPIQTLCREECKGLCVSCGANLNREECSCSRQGGDPRLAKLKGLKIEE